VFTITRTRTGSRTRTRINVKFVNTALVAMTVIPGVFQRRRQLLGLLVVAIRNSGRLLTLASGRLPSLITAVADRII